MKYLILLLLLVTGTQLFSQDTTTVSTAEVVDEIYDRTEQAIASMAQALEVPAKHVYSIAVKQQKINAFTYLFVFVLSIVFFQLCMTMWKKHEQIERSYDDESLEAIFAIIFGGISFMMFFIFVLSLDDTFTGLFNPEYGAINNIVNWIN